MLNWKSPTAFRWLAEAPRPTSRCPRKSSASTARVILPRNSNSACAAPPAALPSSPASRKIASSSTCAPSSPNRSCNWPPPWPPRSAKCSANKFMLAFTARNHQLVAVKKPLPSLRPRWVLVKVRLAGICNTDVEILRGYHAFRGVPGHEFVGEVAALNGASAKEKTKWLGKRVTGEINVSCSAYNFRPECTFCRRGLKTHCARRTVVGIVNHDGAFAEYLALPLENLHLVPDSVTDEQAVFVEPLAAACEILEQVNIQHFRAATVLGDGKLAQLIARVLRTALPRVVMYGKHRDKLKLAAAAKIETRKVRGNPSDLNHVKENYPLVIEATGSPLGLSLAQQITAPRGTLVLKSTFHGAAPVETWPIVVKELTVIGSRCGPFRPALELLRLGRVDPRPLISEAFRLKGAAEAIRQAQERGVMKVLLG